jgi:hypothetical protein
MVGTAQADFDQGMEAYKHHDLRICKRGSPPIKAHSLGSAS